MREDYFDLKNFETAQREELLRFFPESLVRSFTNWQAGSWLEIMRRCRFGRLTEVGANRVTIGETRYLSTVLLARYKETLRLYVSDGVNMFTWRVNVINGWGVEEMRSTLYSYVLPANVDVTGTEAQRRQLLLSALEKCFDSPDFILA